MTVRLAAPADRLCLGRALGARGDVVATDGARPTRDREPRRAGDVTSTMLETSSTSSVSGARRNLRAGTVAGSTRNRAPDVDESISRRTADPWMSPGKISTWVRNGPSAADDLDSAHPGSHDSMISACLRNPLPTAMVPKSKRIDRREPLGDRLVGRDGSTSDPWRDLDPRGMP